MMMPAAGIDHQTRAAAECHGGRGQNRRRGRGGASFMRGSFGGDRANAGRAPGPFASSGARVDGTDGGHEGVAASGGVPAARARIAPSHAEAPPARARSWMVRAGAAGWSVLAHVWPARGRARHAPRCAPRTFCAGQHASPALLPASEANFLASAMTEGTILVTKVVIEMTKVAIETTKSVIEMTKVVIETTKSVIETTKVVIEATKIMIETTKVVIEMTKVMILVVKKCASNTANVPPTAFLTK